MDDAKTMLVKKGSSATLDCSLSNSQSSVKFYRLGRFGRLYKIRTRSENTEFIGKQKLCIRRVSVSDSGIYVCKSVGIRRKRISLFVATGNVQITNSLFSVRTTFKNELKGKLKSNKKNYPTKF